MTGVDVGPEVGTALSARLVFSDGMGTMAEDSAEAAYEAIASAYDGFTVGYQAASWTGQLVGIAEGVGVPGRRLLDVGCGTGKSFLPMLERGWDVVGCDLSPAMVEVARGKVGDEVRLEVADVRELPVFGAFDLVWALNDTLNYLLSVEDLEVALVGMRENLGPGGVLLCDLNALLGFRGSYAGEVVRGAGEERMAWRGLEAMEDIRAGAILEARVEASGGVAVHRQRHFPQEQVVEVMGRAGLECLQVWGELEGELRRPLDEERHTKAVYVGRATK